MLIDKVAEELYHAYSLEEDTILQNNAEYKEAEEQASQMMAELKKKLSDDERKFFFELENCINHRDEVSSRGAYKYAFKQGAKFILELLDNRL